jgi:hypothetical protein
LVEIKEGHHGQVDLAGVTVLAVYNGGRWIKFFVSENATKAQTDAVVEFLPAAEGFFEAPVRDVRNLPIAVKRTKGKVKITTEGTLIELEQIRNAERTDQGVRSAGSWLPWLALSQPYSIQNGCTDPR